MPNESNENQVNPQGGDTASVHVQMTDTTNAWYVLFAPKLKIIVEGVNIEEEITSGADPESVIATLKDAFAKSRARSDSRGLVAVVKSEDEDLIAPREGLTAPDGSKATFFLRVPKDCRP